MEQSLAKHNIKYKAVTGPVSNATMNKLAALRSPKKA